MYSVDSRTKEVKDEFGIARTIYEAKPELKKRVEVVGWKDLCSFDHEPIFNEIYGTHSWLDSKCMDIDDEEIRITNKVFVADEDKIHLFSDKIVEETDVDKDVSKVDYNFHIRKFNEMMIESNEKMNAYCKLHKLDLGETDAIELFKLIYPGQEYEIKDGKMICKEMPVAQTGTIKGTITGIVCDPGRSALSWSSSPYCQG